MLSRTAQGLYWMSRYLERAHHLCRLLGLQSEALIDRPISEIHLGWSRIYASLGRQPPSGANVIVDSDDYTLADSYTLADDLTFESTNSDSVWSCFALGRENARQMRRAISAEMWFCLNLTYLRVRNMTIQDIWRTSPEGFYTNLVSEIDRFTGVSAATMYRDEGWQFMRLGSSIERLQLMCSLLLTQIELEERSEESADADWTSLLRLQHAFEAYNRRYSVEVEPDAVIDLLVTDAQLPGSLVRSLDAVASELAALESGAETARNDSTNATVRRLTESIQHDWPGQKGRKDFLSEVSVHARELHQLLNNTYFEYSSEEVPEV